MPSTRILRQFQTVRYNIDQNRLQEENEEVGISQLDPARCLEQVGIIVFDAKLYLYFVKTWEELRNVGNMLSVPGVSRVIMSIN